MDLASEEAGLSGEGGRLGPGNSVGTVKKAVA